MNRKKLLPYGVGLAIIIVLLVVFTGGSKDNTTEIIVPVQQGPFIVDITTSGSLEAKNSVEITGPKGLRRYRIWNITVQDIIDEGTYVEKGQYVARLDPSELTGRISDAQLNVDEEMSQYIQTKLDTALTMRQARDELINLEYDVRDRQLTLDQSQFEPPATIQKAEIELEKAKRALSQAKENYEIKRQQNVAKMQERVAELSKEQNDLKGLQELANQFVVTAPEAGMLIYKKSWDGKPIKAGSQVSAWDPVVATLPDLSEMLSTTYVNEVDIRKVKRGQLVDIGFDAFPDKKLKGRVTKVANVGEQRPNSDAKVFEVEIEVFGTDELLKPGMTTSNRIITQEEESANYIPLECLHSQFDSVTFVYKKSGLNIIKQEVMLGEANSDHVIILAGLEEGDRIYLSNVVGKEDNEIVLIPEMDGKRLQKQEEIPDPEPLPEPGPGNGFGRRRPNS
jgi:HlyD family secretion protein